MAQDDSTLDFLTSTKCLEIWLKYLGEERFNEEKLLGDRIDKNWWNITFKSIEIVTPKKLNKISDKVSLRKNKTKGTNDEPTLWKE